MSTEPRTVQLEAELADVKRCYLSLRKQAVEMMERLREVAQERDEAINALNELVGRTKLALEKPPTGARH